MKRHFIVLCIAVSLIFSGFSLQDAMGTEKTTASETVSDEVQSCVEDKAFEKRRQIMQEAVNAIDDTRKVLQALDEGKIEEAKTALQTVLSTLVVINNVIPLPLVRAEEMLVQAETLAENKNRKPEENDELESLLHDAHDQFEMAAALGYITESDCEKTFFKEIEEIKKKTGSGKSGTGFFDKIKARLSDLDLLSWTKNSDTK